MDVLVKLLTPTTFFILAGVAIIGLLFILYKKDNVTLWKFSFGNTKTEEDKIKQDYENKLCHAVQFEWKGEENDTAIRIRSNLIQLFGVFNTEIHKGGLSYLREVWPNEKSNIILDITDSNVPSTLLGLISEKENQKIFVVHRTTQNDNVAVLNKYKNVKLIKVHG